MTTKPHIAAADRRIRVVLLTHWLSDIGGGVTTVVKETACEMSRRDCIDLHVVGLTDQSFTKTGHDWGASQVHSLKPARGWRRFGYARRMARLLDDLDADIVHVHGLWTYCAIAADKWRLRSPEGRTVISPHGMLEPWALRNGRWKKFVFGMAFQRRSLCRADRVHALTAAEAREIKRYAGDVPVSVVPNGVSIPRHVSPDTSYSCAATKTLLYLGRLHPKKNLPLLLRAWARAGMATEGWCLRIAGWDQAGHRADLEKLCAELGIGAKVSFPGALYGAEKEAAYHAATAVVLPSISEGLPMVVLEAWSQARPVLMTDACNLPEGFETGAAFRLRPNEMRATQDLVALLKLPGDRIVEAGQAGLDLVNRAHLWPTITSSLIAMYSDVLPYQQS